MLGRGEYFDAIGTAAGERVVRARMARMAWVRVFSHLMRLQAFGERTTEVAEHAWVKRDDRRRVRAHQQLHECEVCARDLWVSKDLLEMHVQAHLDRHLCRAQASKASRQRRGGEAA